MAFILDDDCEQKTNDPRLFRKAEGLRRQVDIPTIPNNRNDDLVDRRQRPTRNTNHI